MKLSTARRLVCMSYFTVDGLRPLLATATRIVCSGDTKRFLFPDGSVIESTKGNWKVVGMEKNPKLEAAVKRFGGFTQGGYNPSHAITDEIAGVVAPGAYAFSGSAEQREAWMRSNSFLTFESWLSLPNAGEGVEPTPFISERTIRLQMEVLALQELCNEKDEQLDKASRPMVVRLDWWAVALVATVLIAHYVFKVL